MFRANIASYEKIFFKIICYKSLVLKWFRSQMYLKQLDITSLRNLKPQRLHFSPGVNAFYGANGSGKTSILEAIHVLSLGRSFRTANLQQVIQFEESKYVVAGVIDDVLAAEQGISIKVGTERARERARTLFIRDGERCFVGELYKLLPILLFDSSSLELLIGGADWRRDFIDLGMFHVEHSFLGVCQRFKRCLLQRNAELKAETTLSQKRKQIEAWNETFISTAEAIDAARKAFLADFVGIFNNLIAGWQYCGQVSFQYKQGWADDLGLEQVLENNLLMDLACGFTNRGPHRAELEICVDGVAAKTVLSRGQQKVFVCAMLLAKAVFLKEKAQINNIFLVDDLNSELDSSSFKLVFDKLVEIGGQIFITGIDREALINGMHNKNGDNIKTKTKTKIKLFHVEQFGVVVEDDWGKEGIVVEMAW